MSKFLTILTLTLCALPLPAPLPARAQTLRLVYSTLNTQRSTLLHLQSPISSPYAATQSSVLSAVISATQSLSSCTTITAPGAYRVTTNLSANWDCLKIQTNNVTLDCGGSTITGKNYRGDGIRVGDPASPPLAHIEIHHCRINHFLYGIAVEGGTNVTIHDNDLSNNFDDTNGSHHGAWLGLFDGGGIRLNRVQTASLTANVANNATNGIDIRDSAHITVTNNTTTANTAFGIALTNTGDSLIQNNHVQDNFRWCTYPGPRGDIVVRGCDSAGILLSDGSSRDKIIANQVLGQNGDGIFIRNYTGRCGDDNLLENNTVTGAVWNAVEVGYCRGITLQNNDFATSQFGVWISYMDGVTVRNNQIHDIAQTGLVLKNSNHALLQSNTFNRADQGILLLGDTTDQKFGWTLPHPFTYYRSYANTITGNNFLTLTHAPIHLINSTENQISANHFINPAAVIISETKDALAHVQP